MPKRLIALFFALSLFIPTLVYGQGQPQITQMMVELWPEYDRPMMLVIYRVVLDPQTSFPVDLSFRIPTLAGEPNAVAVRQMDGSLVYATYERQVSGEWAFITVTATSPEVQLEYYDPQLEIDGQQRHYEYRWLGDYSVDSLTMRVQEPIGATQIRFSPDLGSPVQGEDDLLYYTEEVGSLATGQSFVVEIDYQKSTDALSVESLSVEPSTPITDETQGRVNLLSVLPWVLGAFGIFLIGGGVWWYWQSGGDATRPRSRRRRKAARVRKSDIPASSESGIYCHQCGKRAHAGDRFCRFCGTKLRSQQDGQN
ncbi:MAG: zinc ribbon domain-containing protein [Anaerolineales bacterium]|jgi:hypothetical protein